MTDNDRPTRHFSRGETFEILTPEGKSHEPKLYGCVLFDNEDSDYKLCVFSYYSSESEDQVAAFGGLTDRTLDSFTYDPCPMADLSYSAKARAAFKEGKLREFVDAEIRDQYDRWHEDLLPEIREVLAEFSLAYWRRELFLRDADEKEEDAGEPAGPSGEEDAGNGFGPMVTGGLS